MTHPHTTEYLLSLLNELRLLPDETGWVEFKANNENPQEIGEYLSALANSAALEGKVHAYVVWGVEDESHDIVGTRFRPAQARKGNEELESWLLRLLTPRIGFRFFEVDAGGKHVVILEIDRASHQPVQFEGREYIRIGSYKKPLKDYPEQERALWRIFDQRPFEDEIARLRVSDEDLLGLIDYSSYFSLLGIPLPPTKAGIIASLAADRLISHDDAGAWSITNLGALLFARLLEPFPNLRRKAIRVITYRGDSRLETEREQLGSKGYASGFQGLIAYINARLPSNEVMGQALRRTVPMYPEIAIRELVVNALIHQDFSITGAGPMVEIFSDRLEITNPGTPLVSTDRFLDNPPRSRNEGVASLMRRMGVCEERGSGIDKVVFQTEFFQLPAPLFEVAGESTRVVLFAHRPLNRMDKDDRVRACYLHACLKYVGRGFLTNTSIRERFGLSPKNSASASRLIKEAVDAGVIVPADDRAAKKFMKYVPWWVAAEREKQEAR